MGGIGGSIDRALAGAQRNGRSAAAKTNLRRLMVPGLATWDPAANAAKRLVAQEAELSAATAPRSPAGQRAGRSAAAHPRSRRYAGGGARGAAAAPADLGWLEAQKDALKLRDDVLKEAANGRAAASEKDLVRRGERLKMALDLSADPDFAAVLTPAKDYLAACEKAEKAAKSRARRIQAVSYVLLARRHRRALAGVIEKEWIGGAIHWFLDRPALYGRQCHAACAERRGGARGEIGETFRECAKNCPEMVVIPAGTFIMGSPDGGEPVIGLDGKPKPGAAAAAEEGRGPDEGPQHEVRIGHAFAAGKYAVTFDEWDECVKFGPFRPSQIRVTVAVAIRSST